MTTQWMIFLYGFMFGIILMKFVNEASKTGTVYGECPYCRETNSIKYFEVYECKHCGKRYTNSEAYSQHAANEEADEYEREYQFQRQQKLQRTEEYNDKLHDLNNEYQDVKKSGRVV